MTTADRRAWMRNYMATRYRRNPEKYEKLKEAHRWDSFLWRISKFLTPQYEIIMCAQYGPFFDVEEANNQESTDSTCDDGTNSTFDPIDESLMLKLFKLPSPPIPFFVGFEVGGGEIFKILCLFKNVDPHRRLVVCSEIYVLDKAALFQYLKGATRYSENIYKGIIRKLEKEQDTWHEIDFSNARSEQPALIRMRWTDRKDPDWESSQFQAFLRIWEMGARKIAKRTVWEGREDGLKIRSVASPIFEAMSAYSVDSGNKEKARNCGSRP
jgi:hypothetical protein